MASESGLYVTPAPPPAPAWGWRAGAAAASLAALALLASILAHWGWTWFGPKPVFIGAPTQEIEFARRAAEAHLFGSAGIAPAAAPVGADLGDIRLLGVFAEREGKGYALLRAGTRPATLVAAGQDLAPGVRVESVRADGVSVLQGGVRHELALHAPSAGERTRVAAAAAATPAACAIPPGFKGPVVRLNAELLGGMIDAPDTWKVLVAPASGALVVRDQSGSAGMLGLKNGDRVERANGIPLALPDDIAATILRPLTQQPARMARGNARRQAAAMALSERGFVPGLITVTAGLQRASRPRLRRRGVRGAREPIQQVRQRLEIAIGIPRSRRFVGSDVTVGGEQRMHAGGASRDDVALGVSDVDASRRQRRERRGGGEQRCRMGLGLWRRIAADDGAGTPGQRESLDDRHREADCLVGHNAPAQTPALDLGQHLLGIRKKRRLFAQRLGVVRQESVAQRCEIGVLLPDAEARRQQSARAVRGLRAQRRQRQRRQCAVGAHTVQRDGEIGSGIGQRPIEVEQDG